MIVLPLDTRLPHYDFTVTLDGVPYLLEFHWNTRDEAWYLDIRTADGVDIATGLKVVLETPLALRCQAANKPPGMLLAIDTSGRQVEAQIDDLGSRVRLCYLTAAEVADL